MKIQFLLLSDGPSHKLLGLNVVKGLNKLGIETKYYFPNRNNGEMLYDPDYVFCLKPRKDSNDLISRYYKGKSKIALIINDEFLEKEKRDAYDFYVSPSIDWKEIYNDKPCYLVKEEFDFFQTKKHNDSFNIVTFGFKENLIHHLPQVISKINEKINLTIISNFSHDYILPKEFNKCNLVWTNYVGDFFNKMYDKRLIENFKNYDVGLITQYENSGRTSNRLKALMYAGLPVVTVNNKNHEDLWFNKEKTIKQFINNNNEWIESILELKEKKKRQDITDFNYEEIKKNAGIVNSAKSFLKAIKDFEND